ncbi:hypothetical protein TAC_0073 [Acinetobacter phage TAC1]|nr:hypothetical protein TAC_0073 [Acinetobacter phage TAC1]
MFVIVDQYGCYLAKIWTAQPSDKKGEVNNFVINSHFHHDFERALKFSSNIEASAVLGVLDHDIDARVKELKQVVYHAGEQRYLKSINIEQAHSHGKVVTKSVAKWCKSVDEALPFTDQEGLKAIVALTERGENLNGNFGYVTVKYV